MLKNNILALVFSCLCLSAALASAPPANVRDEAPFNQQAYHFTSVRCIGEQFDCAGNYSDDQLLAKANACARETFGFPATLLGEFSREEPYLDCALPVEYVDKSASPSGKSQWPICCVIERNRACTFICHSYYIN